ncbi:hypothetical protein phiK7B1_143 [Pseudomonas phage phiK7B1]|nr:hypothetical protein phiK7B1_143 [Pseudomonas phage phiK7B1]
MNVVREPRHPTPLYGKPYGSRGSQLVSHGVTVFPKSRGTRVTTAVLWLPAHAYCKRL